MFLDGPKIIIVFPFSREGPCVGRFLKVFLLGVSLQGVPCEQVQDPTEVLVTFWMQDSD